MKDQHSALLGRSRHKIPMINFGDFNINFLNYKSELFNTFLYTCSLHHDKTNTFLVSI